MPPGDNGSLAGAFAGALRATKRDPLVAAGRRSSLAAAAMQASAASRSPYGGIVAALEDAELRSRGMRLIASQDAVAKARADIATANTEVLEELEENFKFRPDEKLLARSPMNRSMRASGRMTDATRALDDELNSFMSDLGQMMHAIERRRAEDVQRAEERLRVSEITREQARTTHDSESHDERLGRLKAALRLTANWKSATLAGQRQARALIAILRSELAGIEAAWEADVQRREAALQAQAAASRKAFNEMSEECRIADASQREAHAATMAALQAAHDSALEALTKQLEGERSVRRQLEADLQKAQTEAARTISRLQTEVDGYRNYSSTANHALQSNTKALREEKETAQDEADQRIQSLRESMLAKQRALEEEVHRLRTVQEEVLMQGGALPGSEVRQYLFFEATKARRLLQPDATISWRGQREQRSPKTRQTQSAHRPSPKRPESARQPRAPPFTRGY